jgi:hypothetical protein
MKKIKKAELLKCKYLTSISVTDAKISFEVQLVDLSDRFSSPEEKYQPYKTKTVQVDCPNIDNISVNSFNPPEINGTLTGTIVLSLLDSLDPSIPNVDEKTYMDMFVEEVRERNPDLTPEQIILECIRQLTEKQNAQKR